ncbi:AAA family ATPase [Aneurinibacillus migulanus]|uniref:ATPase family associated with various cellular activities (AAA) n=1 Tax=Aneurinibacillus migulanus TaxID=47500 RepID=A0A0D1XET2_ANEMI|nr:ATP-binding protein [Aneurinibacillus migulanus]KIV52906.1 hypothetical protein TS65_22680 [Aneurinibacillus migulanus]KON95184.1 hypothetical protein AF333_06520 [Aneurinibacillus migulanus]MED0890921.1 AAA family ATPase [Aneurinibacillus migulanus]MED1616613.1 AAA family ATPase [Aneurinibacillus migulanus]SDI82646.1 ATPase family associated with various cellular activities (AAA) [Aneurinibacillus migulanus]
MAKGAHLKKLFQSYRDGNDELFKDVAQLIIEDEQKKNHLQLAEELQRIINSTVTRRKAETNFQQNYFHLLPKDKDSNYPLMDIKQSKKVLADLILAEEMKNLIIEFIQEFEQADILASYGLTARNRFLFCGPPGCGKTVTAEAIAGELSLPLLYIRFDSVVSSYLGETASNLRKVFDFATKGTWVLFFDEFDAIAKSRDNSDEHGELKRVVNSFLQLLDNYHGNSIVIAATNHQQLLDSAIWRRFDDVLFFEKPNVTEIKGLLTKHLKRFPYEAIDVNKLAVSMNGFSHADIERVCLTTIKRAIIHGEKMITHDDLKHQIELYQKRNRVYNN